VLIVDITMLVTATLGLGVAAVGLVQNIRYTKKKTIDDDLKAAKWLLIMMSGCMVSQVSILIHKLIK
jgi:coproporphyrinogen III oxidase-like Fe-S oxidoreductase